MTDFLFNEMPHLSINEVIETLTIHIQQLLIIK